jgi:hypothetical protein
MTPKTSQGAPIANHPDVASPSFGSLGPKDSTSSIHSSEGPWAELMKIRALAHALPGSVSLGLATDVWEIFFVSTGAHDQAYIDAFKLSQDPDPSTDWEVCNMHMHWCFDYNITCDQLASQIRRGPLGVLAMVQFLTFMVKSCGVDLSPLDECLALTGQGPWAVVSYIIHCLCSSLKVFILG